MRVNYPEPWDAIRRPRHGRAGANLTVGLEIAAATVWSRAHGPCRAHGHPAARAEAWQEAHARHRNAYPRFFVMSYNTAS